MQKASHDISIALIQKDIEYIKQNVSNINSQLQVMDKNYVRHEELQGIMKLFEEVKKQLDTKLNIADFEPIKSTLTKINWLIIAAIVGAILAIIIKSS